MAPSACQIGDWQADFDGDGWLPIEYIELNRDTTKFDCDNRNEKINPDQLEVCDGVDNDCDKLIDEDDATDALEFYRDGDGDGHGDPADTTVGCTAPDGFVAVGDDCDDADGERYPGRTEECNDIDDDCDGVADDGLVELRWYLDADHDGYGDVAEFTLDCNRPNDGEPWVDDHTDCDDADGTVFPDAPELCDGKDNDCDGVVDDGLTLIHWYTDADGDGYGDPASLRVQCPEPEGGGITVAGDCDDTRDDVFPGAPDVVDGIDNDCDGVDGVDADGDGYASIASGGDDCNDANAEVYPGAAEIWYDGRDQDCDGLSDYDQDRDGYDTSSFGGRDCDDTDNTIYPGATDTWYDGVDSDCNGESDYDADLDGYDSAAELSSGTDCDDDDALTHPGAAPNDSTTACMTDADGDGYGSDSPLSGVSTGTDCDDGDEDVHPGATDAWYDGVDADCDGASDYDADLDGYDSADELSSGTDCDDTDAFVFPGAAEAEDFDGDGVTAGAGDADDALCTHDADEDGYGDDDDSGAFQAGTDCDDTDEDVYPGADDYVGNGVDESCDGVDGLDADGDGYASDAYGGDDCDDSDASVYPGATDVWYDGVDSDCAGDSDYDQDLDGYDATSGGGSDCADTDAGTFPGAASTESTTACMTDADGDGWGDAAPATGVTAGTDCDDADADTFPGAAPEDSSTACMTDADGDGYGSDSPASTVTAGTDCDDTRVLVNPAATEIWYNGRDDDCSGGSDYDRDGDGYDSAAYAGDDCVDTDARIHPYAAGLEDFDGDGLTAADGDTDDDACTADLDGDGFGDSTSTAAYDPGTDCDDSDPDIFPASAELEDLDADGLSYIDGDADELDYCTEDKDADGWGDESVATGVDAGTDCRDADEDTYPGAAELESTSACMTDADADGFGDDSPATTVEAGTDCDDADSSSYPGAPDAVGDGVDQGCDGTDGEDADLDGQASVASGGTDCDDGDATIYTGATDDPGDDVDEDCSGYVACYADVDRDGSGAGSGGESSLTATAGHADVTGACGSSSADAWDDDADDCDDADADTFPGAAYEESASSCRTDVDGDGYGDLSPASGVSAGGDCLDSDATVNPGATDDGGDDVDEDCSGYVACWTDADADSWGDALEQATVAASNGASTTTSGCAVTSGVADVDGDCDDGDAATFPGAAYNESATACMTDADGDGYGDAAPASGVTAGTDCLDSDATVYAGGTEVAGNDLDEDCSGYVACWDDGDGDSWGDTLNSSAYAASSGVATTSSACTTTGLADQSGDCDDADATTFPGAAEAESSTACMTDADADGYGDESVSGSVTAGTDCDDSDAGFNPVQTDVPGDGWDQDCTDRLACYVDADDDGYGLAGSSTEPSGAAFVASGGAGSATACGASLTDSVDDDGDDCDDTDATENPDVTWYADDDRDGYGDSGSGSVCVRASSTDVLDATDCLDTDDATYPGAAEAESATACMTDGDGDGWGDISPSSGVTGGTDCNDASAFVYPGAAGYEDLDGDGLNLFDDADADELDYCTRDQDGDGWGAVSSGSSVFDGGNDCNDTIATIHPGAADLEDLDGDGLTLSDGDVDELDYCTRDEDSDGFGSTTVASGVDAGTDCQDSDADTFPGAAELESTTDCMTDADDDGWGSDSPATGTIAVGTDCDDATATTWPGAPDSIDGLGVDDDCDGVDGVDADGDTWASTDSGGTDCLDSNPDVNPGATDVPGDDYDDNCNGYVACYVDDDGDEWGEARSVDAFTSAWGSTYTATDGIAVTSCGSSASDSWADVTGDCDDADPFTYPGAASADSSTACMTDGDGDGYGDETASGAITAGTDCDDGDASLNPGQAEVYGDDIDDNCNDAVGCYVDGDADSWGDAQDDATVLASGGTVVSTTCATEGGLSYVDGDCDDGDAFTYPGAAFNESATACMTDADGDGWGDLYPSSGVTAGTDCLDTDATVYAGGTEVAGNDLDEDCDSFVACWDDGDADAWGDTLNTAAYAATAGTATTTSACTTTGLANQSGDCDDGDGYTFPGAAEAESATACMTDADADGYGDESVSSAVTAGTDCADGDGAINPSEVDVPGDDTDQDCSGTLACYVDADNDGYGASGSSTESGSYPATGGAGAAGACASSVSDGLDDDGDDCDDTDATETPDVTWYADVDLDGYGDASSSSACVRASSTDVLDATDCDDGDNDTFPGAAELDSSTLCMTDADADGYGDDNARVGVTDGTDCDDGDADVFPASAGLEDLDGDGLNWWDDGDVGELSYCTQDQDGDGWGDVSPSSGVDSGTDCLDTSDTVYPGAGYLEDLDGDGLSLDDGDADELDYCTRDDDADGFGDATVSALLDAGTDCDDARDDTFPGAAEIESSTACMTDADDDGWGSDAALSPVTAGSDCDDATASTWPGASDSVDSYGVDDNCDGVDGVDSDGDTWASAASGGSDCLDSNAGVHPGATDVPGDDYDDNCNGFVACYVDDDGDTWGEATTVDAGSSAWGSTYTASGGIAVTSCGSSASDNWADVTGDCDDADADTFPGAAATDSTSACMTDGDGDGYGDEAATGSITAGTDCDDADARVNPGEAEVYGDDIDDNCNDAVGCYVDGDTDTWGDAQDDTTVAASGGSASSTTCATQGGLSYVDGDCDDADADTFPGSAENESSTSCMTDADADGYGDLYAASGVTAGTDCLDADDTVYAGASVVYGDDLDQDCDGYLECYADVDLDGWGDLEDDSAIGGITAGTASTSDACDTSGYASVDGDCDDGDDHTFPGAAEEESAVACMTDADSDGYGDAAATSPVTAGADCDDTSALTWPGIAWAESTTDCMLDADGDGYGDDAPSGATVTAGNDCNDGDATVNPGVRWDWYTDPTSSGSDAVDANCDGQDYQLLEPSSTVAALAGYVGATFEAPTYGSSGYDVYLTLSRGGQLDSGTNPGMDLAFGAPLDSTGGAAAGGVYLVLSGSSGLAAGSFDLSTSAIFFEGDAAGDGAGVAVQIVDDLDADGDDELLVAAPYEDTGGTDAGAIYVVPGDSNLATSAGSALGTMAGTIYYGSGGDVAGWALASANLDGSGTDEVIVGAPFADETSYTNSGRVYIMAAGTGAGTAYLNTAPAILDTSSYASYEDGSLAGFSLSGGPDFNGDGIDDLLIGIPYGDYDDGAGTTYTDVGVVGFVGGVSGGSAYLSSLNIDAAWYGGTTTANADDHAGWSVALVGDVDHDGYGDAVVGAPGFDDPTTGSAADIGSAYLVRGSTSVADLDLAAGYDARLQGAAASDELGTTVGSAGYLDDDLSDDNTSVPSTLLDYVDVLVGAPGATGAATGSGVVYVLHGHAASYYSGGTVDLTDDWVSLYGENTGDAAGSRVQGLGGDYDGDSVPDCLVGTDFNSSTSSTFENHAYLLLGEQL